MMEKKGGEKMEEPDVKQEMGKRMVEAMDPALAKEVLWEIISGTELYTAILSGGTAGRSEPAKKKRKKWTRRHEPMQNVLPMPPVPGANEF